VNNRRSENAIVLHHKLPNERKNVHAAEPRANSSFFREFLFQNNLPGILFFQSNDTRGSTIIRRCDWSLQSAQTIKKQGRKDRKRHVDAENGTFSFASKKSFLKEFVLRLRSSNQDKPRLEGQTSVLNQSLLINHKE
jgi:hypothetical protein